MTQLVLGAALGFIIGQSALHGARQLIGWLLRDGVLSQIRSLRGFALLGGFIRYSGVIAAIGALITLGVWTVGDYLAASAARRVASANALNHAIVPPPPARNDSADESAESASHSNSPAAPVQNHPDPYQDPDFKVHRRPHRAGAPLSLKEILVQRSEAKARTELLAQIKEHMHRSQYDCEAADRANRYLSIGLDVWAFANWQVKYFPMNGYKGATLQQCKNIENLVDASAARTSDGA